MKIILASQTAREIVLVNNLDEIIERGEDLRGIGAVYERSNRMLIVQRTISLARGFTLLEITLSIAILSGIIFGTIALFGAVTSARAKTAAAQEVSANARVALSLIEQRIRSAIGINSASSTFGIHPGVLSLAQSDSAENPTVFSVSGQHIQIQESSSSPLALTGSKISISNLVFTHISYPGSPDGIRIDLTVQYNNPSNDPNYAFSRSYQSMVMLRR